MIIIIRQVPTKKLVQNSIVEIIFQSVSKFKYSKKETTKMIMVLCFFISEIIFGRKFFDYFDESAEQKRSVF